MQRIECKGCNYLLTGPGATILEILRADAAMHTWFVVMAILLGGCALTLNRFDVQTRVLILITIGWFVLGALLLGYRGEHL